MGTIKSKDASGSPCNNANDFDKVNYLTDKMIKDPHYLYIMRYPDFHHIIDPINQHTISITDLQQVVTNLITADKETRTWVETLAKMQQVCTYKHDGFWSPMETRRDRSVLEQMWNEGEAPWKTWRND